MSELKLYKVTVSVDMAVLANSAEDAELTGEYNFRNDPRVKVISENMTEDDLIDFGSLVP